MVIDSVAWMDGGIAFDCIDLVRSLSKNVTSTSGINALLSDNISSEVGSCQTRAI